MGQYFSIKKPNSPLLQPYIECFYFQEETENTGTKEIFFYPSKYTTLSVYQKASVEIEGLSTNTVRDLTIPWSVYYTGYHKECGNARIETPFVKFGVVFKALGFNHFIDDDLHSLLEDASIVAFHHFGKTFDSVLEKVFEVRDEDQKVRHLEAFFKEQLRPFPFPKLKEVIHSIEEKDERLSVTDIAQKFDLDRKQLLRLFKRHLNLSVRDFTGILTFSKVINAYLEEHDAQSLTKLIYRFGYYDQAKFTNEFKKIVGASPKKILNLLKKTSEEEQFWKK